MYARVAEAVEPAPTAVAVVDPVSARTRPGDGMTWPVDAWLKVDGGHDAPVPIVREIVRIGREDDNDIVLPLSTVHRYHAVVQRTEEAELEGSLADRFDRYDPNPLGTASLAQAHAARLKDGTPVVVKVLHQGVEHSVDTDLAALK